MTKPAARLHVDLAGALALAILFLAPAATFAVVAPLDPRANAEISAAVGGAVEISRHGATGAVRFLRATDAAGTTDLAPTAGSLDARARSFFAAQGALFGVRDPRAELFLQGEKRDGIGQTHLTYHQYHRGVPVFAGILRAHFDSASRLRSVNGAFVPGLDLDVRPAIAADAASRRAIDFVRDRNGRPADAPIYGSEPRLVVYRLGLDRGIAGAGHLAWAVTVANGGDIREFVFVDARYGKVVDWLPGIHEAMDRRAYLGTDGNGDQVPDTWPGSPTWEESDPFPTLIQEQNNMLISSEDVYTRFFNGFARDSYDDAGSFMDQAYNRNYACPNASWNGSLISFCPGFTTHDVTAHEWGHAYTEYTHSLIYRWQSGALNEAYSDIWGEAFDINASLSPGMVDTDNHPVRSVGDCPTPATSVRWRMGEDVAGGGALRDMWNPNCFSDPGKVSDTQYFCGSGDNGGVHFNSGVPNHAFALLVDGGTYNSQTITAIGFVKALHAYYRAMTVYQVATSDFPDHADALEASCNDLATAATSLADPWGGGPQTMQAADCVEVADAMLAVQMRTPATQCNYQPMLTQNPPAICTGGQFAYSTYLFDWESGAAGWTVSRRNVTDEADFDERDWVIDSSLPGDRLGSAFNAPNPINGDCVADDETGVLVLESPTLRMALGSQQPRITFDHYMSSEATWDGGNVKVSVNGGAYTVIPPAAYSFNDQIGALASAGAGNTNPMASQQAWHGTDGGTNFGSWGRTIGNLATVVPAGANFKLRYEFGCDGCNGTTLGWWVDDVRLYSCHAAEGIFLDGFEPDLTRWSSVTP